MYKQALAEMMVSDIIDLMRDHSATLAEIKSIKEKIKLIDQQIALTRELIRLYEKEVMLKL